MKILLLCWRDTHHPQGGGSERYLERVGDFLVSQGHEVLFHTAMYPGAPLRSMPRGGGSVGFGMWMWWWTLKTAFRFLRGR